MVWVINEECLFIWTPPLPGLDRCNRQQSLASSSVKGNSRHHITSGCTTNVRGRRATGLYVLVMLCLLLAWLRCVRRGRPCAPFANQAFAALEQRVKGLEERHRLLTQSLGDTDGLKARASKLEKRNDRLATRAEAAEGQLADHSSQLADHASQLANHAQHVSELQQVRAQSFCSRAYQQGGPKGGPGSRCRS